ncbi:MAG: hypothetical protein GX621_00775 [Pirellulaceae bacterium]|nr:hypothetical protein [Pirellulaceae bacterium]
MRHGTRTRGSKRSGGATSVSLFPFLAVLICTVGSLVLLLVVISRQARVEAARIATEQEAENDKQLEEDGEDVRWRIGHLRAALAATQEQLTEARLNLGHVEDHARELRRHLGRLEETVKQLDDAASDSAEQAALRRQLDQVMAKIDETKAKVERARSEATEQGRSYAVIPYEGPNGTRRRPIYIECRADAIILHPEGIVFQPSDFEGSPGPSNPLAVALRAAREYLLEAGRFDPVKAGEPYPLLLVRPTGVHSYYAAREAMSSWESDFGYELIDEDWELRFDPADPKLAQLLQREINRSRLQMEQMAKAAPRHYERVRGHVRGERTEYTVSSTTGVVVPYRGEPTADPPLRRPRWTGGADRSSSFNPDGAASNRAGTETGLGDEIGDGTGGNDVAGGANRSGVGRFAGTGTDVSAGDQSAIAGSTGIGDGIGAGSSRPDPSDSAGRNAGFSAGVGEGVGTGGDAADRPDGYVGGMNDGMMATAALPSLGHPSGGVPANVPKGVADAATGDATDAMAGGSPSATTTTFASQSNAATGDMADASSASEASRSAWDARSGSASANSAGAAQSPPRLGEWNPASSNAGESGCPAASVASSSYKPPPSIAQRRGPDWALPEVAPQSTALTKPIRIECYPNRIALIAERGLTGGRDVALGPETKESMDEFISAVWDYTEGWGIAGRSMYWRPMLHVYVAPGAETRYQDIEALLRDSGLPIERKTNETADKRR